MPSADAETTESGDTTDSAPEIDEARQALLEALSDELGDAVVGHHLVPGRDLWVRVDNAAFSDIADYLRNRQRFRFFDWLSAIDWMPSPYGRSLEAAVDVAVESAETEAASPADGDAEQVKANDDAYQPVAGADTRFQVIGRVYNLATSIGLTVKVDIGDELTVGTWTGTYPGAAWHEREVHEMFGISFTGNTDQRNIYLPTGFEGHPLRKDYPLMARLIKPWPGIVDVEPMPPDGDPA